MALTVTVENDFPGILGILERQFKALSAPSLASSGEFFVRRFADRIKSSAFTRPADSTLSIRRRRGRSGSTPLVDTGELLRSLSFNEPGINALRIGVPMGFGDLLRFGGQTGGFLSGRAIPPRPFLEITTEHLDAVASGLLKDIFS